MFYLIAITSILGMAAAEQVAMPSMTNDNMQPALHNIRPKLEDPLFCFVVRTYWGHGDANGGGLQRFLRSLQRQPHKRYACEGILEFPRNCFVALNSV